MFLVARFVVRPVISVWLVFVVLYSREPRRRRDAKQILSWWSSNASSVAMDSGAGEAEQ